jgi:hypothetical protein
MNNSDGQDDEPGAPAEFDVVRALTDGHLPPKVTLSFFCHMDILPELDENGVAFVAEHNLESEEMLSDPSSSHYRLLNTKVWVRWSKVSDIRVSALLGAISTYFTHSAPLAVSTSVIAALWNNIRRMSDEEVEMFLVMQRLSGQKVYEKWLHTDTILAAIPDDLGETHNRELLSSMASRGFLEESGGLWRAVK